MKMAKISDRTKAILIGGTSHVGKSTLGRFLADKLDWDYICTDSLAKHPGRPWVDAHPKVAKEHVTRHYKNLSVEMLLLDALSHYQQDVLPQVETLVKAYTSDLSSRCLLLEGSALYPRFVEHLINTKSVRGIWLTANDRFLQTRIYRASDFDNASLEEKDLIHKFLDRTLIYDRCVREELESLGFVPIDVEFVPTLEELTNKCLEQINFSSIA